ncbi:hypothetical protein WAF17_11975 [Bernardetia sp. ABR2-2B]|uniref:hypothetical protein n=1 Tax=Bernardetia sp. ABR2-2B TaxID=3127472 RepID=UPI0030CC918B
MKKITLLFLVCFLFGCAEKQTSKSIARNFSITTKQIQREPKIDKNQTQVIKDSSFTKDLVHKTYKLDGTQTQIFKDYNFDKGGYYILGTIGEHDRHVKTLCDTLGEFYTDKIDILNEFKNEWVFSEPDPHFACGYHYRIYICKDGLEVESVSVNLQCNTIVTKSGDFHFDSEKLRHFLGRLKKPLSGEKQFDSIAKAREYRNNLLKNNENLIMTETPKWTEYEGNFRFEYNCPENTTHCSEKRKSLLQKMRKEIAKTYPNEEFELEQMGGSLTSIIVEVRCKKRLFDKFKLYDRSIYNTWNPYRCSLKSYWVGR